MGYWTELIVRIIYCDGLTKKKLWTLSQPNGPITLEAETKHRANLVANINNFIESAIRKVKRG